MAKIQRHDTSSISSPPPPEDVAERSADQDQRAEREQVRLDDPLLLGQAAVEVLADRRECDVDDRAVEEHDARAEDRGEQREPLGAADRGPATSAAGSSRPG